jgi:ATP-dependent RNA circularization protein (DNA/RNA ligase family)
MKPIGIKNYGSIPHLSNSKLGDGDHYIGYGQERILTLKPRDKHDNILVFEKYDGSNVGVAKFENKIFALTRAGYEARSSPYKQHHYFADWVKRREFLFFDMLKNGERITGEWLAQAHGLIYKIEVEPIVFFDYFTANNQRALFEELESNAIEYGLQLPRQLHKGQPITVEQLLPLLNEKTKGIESIELPEGMVYRVERKGKVDFLAKYVRSDFSTGKFCINIDDKDLIWNYKF